MNWARRFSLPSIKYQITQFYKLELIIDRLEFSSVSTQFHTLNLLDNQLLLYMTNVSSLSHLQSSCVWDFTELLDISWWLSKWENTLIDVRCFSEEQYFIDLLCLIVLIVGKFLELVLDFLFFLRLVFGTIGKNGNRLWERDLMRKMENRL